MSTLEPVIARISLWMARIGGGALLAVAILVSIEVGLRSTRLGAFSVGTELATYALAVAATWALAYVVFERAHVRVDVISQRLPPRPRAVFDIVAVLSLAVVGAVLSVGAVEMLMTSLRLGSRSNTTLGIPLALPQSAWVFGLVWFTLVSTYRTVQAVAAFVRRDLAEVSRIAASPSADDEVEEAISETEARLAVTE